MHQLEIVRLCALWDSAEPEKENVPTIIGLIDDSAVISHLADEVLARHRDATHTGSRGSNEMERLAAINKAFAESQVARMRSALKQAIKDGRAITDSERLRSVRNLRDKRLAQSLPRKGDRSSPEALRCTA
jgi:hypothetical protein